jgi:hypothetical protein
MSDRVDRNAIGPAMTATKANVGSSVTSIVVLVLYIVGRWTGLIAIPDATLMADAITGLVTLVVTWAVAWISIYLPANTPKLHPLALVLASLAAVLFLAGCASSQDAQRGRLGAMRTGLAVASALVDVYSLQPACGTAPKGVVLCSSPAVVAQLRSALTLAVVAVTTFQNALIDPASDDAAIEAAGVKADAALSELSASTSQIKAD